MSKGAATLDVVPDGCIDIYWSGSGLQIAGPNTQVATVTIEGAANLAGVRFQPGIAARWLGVSATEQDPDPGNNSAPFAGEAAPASTEIPWIWIVAAVLGLIGAGTATNAIRKARWRRMIDVRPRLDTGGEISLSPIEPVIPIEIHVRVEPGETEASSIPVRDA